MFYRYKSNNYTHRSNNGNKNGNNISSMKKLHISRERNIIHEHSGRCAAKLQQQSAARKI